MWSFTISRATSISALRWPPTAIPRPSISKPPMLRLARLAPLPAGGGGQERRTGDQDALARGSGTVPAPPYRRHLRHGDRHRSKTLRVCELLYAVADRFPGLVPTRQRIQGERALKQQSVKEGYEIDQGLFIAHSSPIRNAACISFMPCSSPSVKRWNNLPNFKKRRADLGEASVERSGNVGHVR